MVTSDKTGDENTEGAINELADDLLKGDSESVTDALEQALESVRAKGCTGGAGQAAAGGQEPWQREEQDHRSMQAGVCGGQRI